MDWMNLATDENKTCNHDNCTQQYGPSCCLTVSQWTRSRLKCVWFHSLAKLKSNTVKGGLQFLLKCLWASQQACQFQAFCFVVDLSAWTCDVRCRNTKQELPLRDQWTKSSSAVKAQRSLERRVNCGLGCVALIIVPMPWGHYWQMA